MSKPKTRALADAPAAKRMKGDSGATTSAAAAPAAATVTAAPPVEETSPTFSDDELDVKSTYSSDEDEDEEETAEGDIVNVDFEFCEIKPIDFQGLKTLFGQTLASDADDLDISGLADDMIAHNAIGTTIKVEAAEGEEADPYAAMTLIDLAPGDRAAEAAEAVAGFKRYLLSRCGPRATRPLPSALRAVLSQPDARAAYLFNERLINMPPQVVPSLLRLTMQEYGAAVQARPASAFQYFLLVSKTYTEVAAKVTEDGEDVAELVPTTTANKAVYRYHPEDDLFAKHATFRGAFALKNSGVSDAKRAFQDLGIAPARELLILTRPQLDAAVAEITQLLDAASAS